jgi:hypothetical protein
MSCEGRVKWEKTQTKKTRQIWPGGCVAHDWQAGISLVTIVTVQVP